MASIKVSKDGVNALTSSDPNDFIVDSSLNTFKIISEGTLTSQTVDSASKTFTVSHGLSYIPVIFAFCKFPDGKVYLPNSIQSSTSTSFFRSWRVSVDSSNLKFTFQKVGSNYNVDIKYYIFEAPISGTDYTDNNLPNSQVAVSKDAVNVLTNTNLDDTVYSSEYDTLKYYTSGSETMTINASDNDVSITVNHNLGYKPFFMFSINDPNVLASDEFSQGSITSSALGDYATLTGYVDSSNLILRATTTVAGGFSANTLKYHYKIFRNDTDL